jgi:hypothetical protein
VTTNLNTTTTTTTTTRTSFNPLNLVAFGVVVVLGGVLVAVLRPLPLVFRDNGITQATQLLLSLILVSLFLERTIEVFITIWRGPRARQLEATVRSHQVRMATLSKYAAAPDRDNAMSQTSQDLESASQAAAQQKSATRGWALWAGFGLGLAISIAGVRTLNSLVTPDSYALLTISQKNFFDLVDVLITAGLICGGSNGLHSILQVFIDLAENTSAKIKTPTP